MIRPKIRVILLFLIVAFGSSACQRKIGADNPEVWQKIHLDFKRLDPDGRYGPKNGKVAVNYEFCVPARQKFWQTVKKIDSTAVRQVGSSGRIGCRNDQWLIIGSTYQPHYQRVLHDLAALPYVVRIEQTFWE